MCWYFGEGEKMDGVVLGFKLIILEEELKRTRVDEIDGLNLIKLLAGQL